LDWQTFQPRASIKDQPEVVVPSGCFITRGRLILASASPRRQAFLRDLGLTFEVRPADIDETPQAGESAVAFVRRLALGKARVVAKHSPDAVVLAADTVVAVDGNLLGKPRDGKEAGIMLRRLSGRVHEVLTGFALCRGREILAEQAVRSEVTFTALSDELIRAYVRTGEPQDKAGGYGIQGQGAFLVAGVSGSYTNVVGLPLAEVVAALQAAGVIAPRI
jgi:septum formation protein